MSVVCIKELSVKRSRVEAAFNRAQIQVAVDKEDRALIAVPAAANIKQDAHLQDSQRRIDIKVQNPINAKHNPLTVKKSLIGKKSLIIAQDNHPDLPLINPSPKLKPPSLVSPV